jgi:hypothetical protein
VSRPIRLLLVLGLAPAAFVAGASAMSTARGGPPGLAVSAAPAQLTLVGSERSTLEVVNAGPARVVVDVATAGFALDQGGRPRLASRPWRSAVGWLEVWPRRLVLRPHSSAGVVVRSRVPRNAEPGDHGALVLLTTHARRVGITVRTRLGVLTLVRVPGRIVRRLTVRRVQVRARGTLRLLRLWLANPGNVMERLPAGGLTLVLRGPDGLRAVLRGEPCDLLPRTSVQLLLRYRGGLRGRVAATVYLVPLNVRGTPPLHPSDVPFHLRL